MNANRLILLLTLCGLGGIGLLAVATTGNTFVSPVDKTITFIGQAYKTTLRDSYDPEPNLVFRPHKATLAAPNVSAQAALILDLNTKETLYEKNPRQKLPIASLTKIMTAIIALEHKNPTDTVLVSARAAQVGENTMGLASGERYTLDELLYGLLLNSANDAAYAISEGVAQDHVIFVAWMNLKAQELGLKDTKFFDPSGLDDQTYSTAADLGKLAYYALKNPSFRKYVKTYELELTSDTHTYAYLQNQTNLLTTYPGVQGIKTGYTELAGLCLATYATNNGVELVGIILNSTDRKGDMILILDYGFLEKGIKVEHTLL